MSSETLGGHKEGHMDFMGRDWIDKRGLKHPS